MPEAKFQQALTKALTMFRPGLNGVTAVYIGRKRKGGEVTGETAVVIAVVKKLPPSDVPYGQMLPAYVTTAAGTAVTDVEESGEINARFLDQHQWMPWKGWIPVPEANALSLTDRRRPCPAGFSIGHYAITAGTLGLWVHKDGRWYVLSNNHVLANSNDGRIGDAIVQPGPADGGIQPTDRIGVLSEFVEIVFEGALPQPPKKRTASWSWKVAKWLPNLVARWMECPYRLAVVLPNRVVQQQNWVDAALAASDTDANVEDTVEGIGRVSGIRDLALGDRVVKAGRTTGITRGYVDGVQAEVSVGYGADRTAVFVDQIIVRADSGEFSAGGDSGSAILTDPDLMLGGLLFAGGTGMTIANKASRVVQLLGIEVG